MLTVQFAVTCNATATLTTIIQVLPCNVNVFVFFTQPPDKHQKGTQIDTTLYIF